MKVLKADVIEAGSLSSTILFLDDEFPHTDWKKVRIGSEEHEPIFMSGAPKDKIALKGKHHLEGLDVEFI